MYVVHQHATPTIQGLDLVRNPFGLVRFLSHQQHRCGPTPHAYN